MSQFDPYHVWLGVPPEEQPPNHYRLLGVKDLEDDPEVIASAADRQMSHLRSFQGGKHAELTQRLLNEAAAARVCLLNPDKKHAYDVLLRAELERQPAEQSAYAAIAEAVSGESSTLPPRAPRPTAISWQMMAFGGAGAMVLVGLFLVYVFWGRLTPHVAQMGEKPLIGEPGKERAAEDLAAKGGSEPESPPAPSPSDPAKPTEEKEPPTKSEKSPSEPGQQAEAKPAVAPQTQKAATAPSPDSVAPAAPSPKPEQPQREESKKLPIPDEAAKERARKLVHETFKEEFDKAKWTLPPVGIVVLIDVSELAQVEHDYGSRAFEQVLSTVSGLVGELRGSEVRAGDTLAAAVQAGATCPSVFRGRTLSSNIPHPICGRRECSVRCRSASLST